MADGVGQFPHEHRSLNGVEAGCVLQQFVLVLPTLTVLAQRPQALGEALVVRHDSSRVAERARLFAGKNLESSTAPQ